MTQSNVERTPPVARYQGLLFRLYGVGLVLMLIFNFTCYHGTFVGKFGWAALWPIYLPAMGVRALLFQGTLAMTSVCPCLSSSVVYSC